MGAYVALIAGPDPTDAHSAIGRMGRRLRAAGWVAAAELEGLDLFVPEGSALPWRRFGPGLLIGDVVDLPSRAPEADAEAAVVQLLERAFGRYVFVSPHRPGQSATAIRDPSGALGALSAEIPGGHLVADQLPAPLLAEMRAALKIDWTGVGAWLRDPGMLQAVSGLEGVRPLIPGVLHRFGLGGGDIALWRPDRLAAAPIVTITAAGEALKTAILRASRGFATPGAPILAEVSGGLDSSIVAMALKAAGAPVQGWLNIVTDDARGDERRYAEALCARLGVDLTVHAAPPLDLAPEAIALSQWGAAPSLNGMDAGFETVVIEAAEAVGARRVFTGLGGDSVLFAFPLRIILRDAVLRRGVSALADPLVEALARWTRTSVWSLMGLGLMGARASPLTVPDWMAPAAADPVHPWLEGAAALPPAKRFQVESLVQTQAALGPCRRTSALDLVHPLLSQPVLEACLRIPVDLLVTGGRDRGLARDVFASDLPALVVQRRSKGDVAIRFGTALIERLDALRAYLLEGRLTAAGLIDRSRLEALLSPQMLPHRNEALGLMRAVAVEAWVRRWEGTRHAFDQGPAGA